MKRLVLKLVMLALPFLAVFGLPAWYVATSGEAFRDDDRYVDEVVAGRDGLLYGLMLDESPYRYVKYRILQASAPADVLALGSSRVLQFRREMFTARFYNAGYMVKDIGEFRALLTALPKEKYPKVVIVGLDQWMFNRAWDDLRTVSAPYRVPARPGPELLGSFSGKLLKFTETALQGRLDLSRAYGGSDLAIGLNARLYSSGFRNDGSMRYGIQVERLLNDDPAASDYRFSDTFERIGEGDGKFMPCGEINAAALDALEAFLVFCRQHDVAVVSFLPPFADSVYNRMRESGRYRGYEALPGALAQLVRKHGGEFYDFSQVALAGSSDREVLDGFHGSEVVYQRVLISMLERGSLLGRYAGAERLRQDLGRARNRYSVYEQ